MDVPMGTLAKLHEWKPPDGCEYSYLVLPQEGAIRFSITAGCITAGGLISKDLTSREIHERLDLAAANVIAASVEAVSFLNSPDVQNASALLKLMKSFSEDEEATHPVESPNTEADSAGN